MDFSSGYSSLVEAELDYGYFNAIRTSADENREGISLANHGSFSCLFDRDRPESSYYNRAVLTPSQSRTPGHSVPDLSLLPEAVRGIEIEIPQQTEAMAEALVAHGFKPGSSLCYLVAEPEEMRETGHRVERFAYEQADAFFDLLELSGAEFPAEKREMKHPYYCIHRFRCHVAFSETGQAAGWATSFLCDDGESVFFANAFTLPEFRRQGYHTALLKARLNEVISLRRKRAFTDVEPGSQSQFNCERWGFQMITSTTIWERAGNG